MCRRTTSRACKACRDDYIAASLLGSSVALACLWDSDTFEEEALRKKAAETPPGHWNVIANEVSDAQIEAYLRKDQPYDCCGSAKSESLGIALIARFETEDPNALVGLPLIKLTEMLANEGLDVLTYAV